MSQQQGNVINVTKADGSTEPLDVGKIHSHLEAAAEGKYEHLIGNIELAAKLHFYNGIPTRHIDEVLIKTAKDMATVKDIWYDIIAKNLMVHRMYKDVGRSKHALPLIDILQRGVSYGVYSQVLLDSFTADEFQDLESAIDYSHDFNFSTAGLEFMQLRYMKKHNGRLIELPQHMFMLIAMDTFRDYHKDRMYYIKKLYKKLRDFYITFPSPEMDALRTESTDYASCVLLSMGDSLDSWVEASKALVLHTAASAGIGIDVSSIASIGDKVKGGLINHGGKIPVLKSIDADIQKAVQNGRRGSATPFLLFFDPEILEVLALKSPRTSIEKRINDLSYGIKLRDLVYERAKAGKVITLFSTRDSKELYEVCHSGNKDEFVALYEQLEEEFPDNHRISARLLLEQLNTEAFENSAYYVINIDDINTNSPYVETIYQSNICVEEVSPTKPVLSTKPDDPAIAICVLGNVNQGVIPMDELADTVDILLRAQTHIMLRQKHPTTQAQAYVEQYRSVGLGFSNHAYWLAKQNLKYGSKEALLKHDEWMELFQFSLIKSSTDIAEETSPAPVFWERSTYAKGIMPIDRYNKHVDELVQREYTQDWDWLRERVMLVGMANVALSMVPPAESSAGPSSQTNGLEPIKDFITYKNNKTSTMKQFAPQVRKLAHQYELAYESKDMTIRYLMHVAVTQKWIDKSISANRFYNPDLFKGGKIPLATLLKDMYFAKYYGVKTLYYTNTRVASVEEQPKQACLGGGCEI